MAEILVVEDDLSLAQHMQALLEYEGYKVVVCNNGSDADQVLKNTEFSLLILDWNLPDMDGPDIARNYRNRGGLAPILMLTGKTEVESKEVAFEAGADDYLTKPYSLREASARIKALLRRTEQLRESLSAIPAPELIHREAGNSDPYLGSIFAGKYKLTELLGEGGSGTVYGALHIALHHPVAVKFLHAHLVSQIEARLRFEREAKALSMLKHPSFVKVLDYGIERGQPYMVLERLHGKALDQILCDQGPLPLSEAMVIFAQICDAMEEAHEAGIYHRDLKPANVFVAQNANGEQLVKIVDFGLAKNLRNRTKLTSDGCSVGTAAYMSPEQCMGRDLDGRSDIYSMGCLMFEVLTGKPPFSAEDVTAMLMKHVQENPPKFAAKIADRLKAGRIEKVVLRALTKDPSKRQQSFSELKRELPMGWF